MPYNRLWVLVEGSDDKRFFESILKPRLISRYDFIQTWEYAQEPSKRIKAFLNSILKMKSGYLCLADINDNPCVTAKKNSIKRKLKKAIQTERIMVVVREIESWYLAGLDDKSSQELNIRVPTKTDYVTKEQFNSLIPNRFDSRIDFMIEALKRFSVETARQKNKSFNYLMAKLCLRQNEGKAHARH